MTTPRGRGTGNTPARATGAKAEAKAEAETPQLPPEDPTPNSPRGELEIHYDGGYSQAHRLAVWAVVITDGTTTQLVARGYLEAPGVHVGEREGLTQALAIAEAHGITVIRGDSLEHPTPIPKHITLKHIPSHKNKADPHTKTYPAWNQHQNTDNKR